MVQTLAVLYFGHDLDAAQPTLVQGLAQCPDILLSPDKGLKNVGHSKLSSQVQIHQILLGEDRCIRVYS